MTNNRDNCEEGSECRHDSEEEFTLDVTRIEALYLDDCLTLMVERELPPDHKSTLGTLRNVAPIAQLPVPIELIDKIAWAVLYTTDADSTASTEATLTLDTSELYLLRELLSPM